MWEDIRTLGFEGWALLSGRAQKTLSVGTYHFASASTYAIVQMAQNVPEAWATLTAHAASHSGLHYTEVDESDVGGLLNDLFARHGNEVVMEG